MVRSVLNQLFPKPHWFPQSVDRAQDWVRLVRFNRSDFVNAPFLDQRALRDGMLSMTVRWDTVADAVPRDARADAHWIFHISHVGSTLLSRFVAELGDVLPLREPLIALSALDLPRQLRAERMGAIVRLLSRTFASGERAVVKATSAVSDIGGEIMGQTNGQAIALRMGAGRYVAARLAGNLTDLRGRGNSRRLRLERQLERAIDPAVLQSAPTLAAISWLCEAVALEKLATQVSATRLLFLDFDQFLEQPTEALTHVAQHLGLPTSTSTIARIVAGPHLNRHAKRPDEAFDRAARSSRLDAVMMAQSEEIGRARAWLEDIAGGSPLAASALSRSA